MSLLTNMQEHLGIAPKRVTSVVLIETSIDIVISHDP